MSTVRRQQILDLCNSWWDAAHTKEGGIGIGENTEKFRLLKNGIIFHELDYEEITAAATGLNKVLLHRGLNTIISNDHMYFWSWTAQMLTSWETRYFPTEQWEIKNLFETTFRAALSHIQPQGTDKESWRRSIQVLDQIDLNTRELANKSHLILSYLAFPLLEAIVKRRCNSFVDYSGRVLDAFSVSQIRGNRTNYAASGRGKRQCSSIHDLLALLYDRVADDDLKRNLDQIQNQAQDFSPGQSFFDLIYEWRNSSLHGSAALPTIGGTILNLIILIAVDEIKEKYDKLREEIWKSLEWRNSVGSPKTPFDFYPP